MDPSHRQMLHGNAQNCQKHCLLFNDNNKPSHYDSTDLNLHLLSTAHRDMDYGYNYGFTNKYWNRSYNFYFIFQCGCDFYFENIIATSAVVI